MNDTVFYVLGLLLVAIALIASFGGLRSDKFPGSRGLLAGAMVAIVALVVATMTFAWRNAADEQSKRDAELAADTSSSDSSTGSTTTTTTASVDGSQVFATAGCTGCHTLADAGSTATTGPDLDGALKGKPPAFIRESIVDPNANIEKSYPPNVMPQIYEMQLSPEELDALVKYLSQSTSAQQ